MIPPLPATPALNMQELEHVFNCMMAYFIVFVLQHAPTSSWM